MPAPRSMGSAWIEKRTSASGYERITLPPITSISCDYNVNLTEMPTIVLGYENNFCMDLGTALRYSVTMKRVNPKNYNDNQNSHPELWSNGRWYRYFEQFFNFWQNFGLDITASSGEYKMVGGFRFHFVPSDTTLYPVIDRNVFLSGALNLQYSTEYMVVQMNLQVARMQSGASGTGSTTTVTMHTESPDGSWLEESVTVPLNFPSIIPYVPVAWENMWTENGQVFMGWSASQGSTVVAYYAGDDYTYTSAGLDLWAVWEGPIDFIVVSPTDSKEGLDYIIPYTEQYTPPLEATTLNIYCVGGGGGAGNCASAYPNGAPGAAGGAGAGGDVNITSFTINRSLDPNPTFTVYVGYGGPRGNNKGVIDSDGPAGYDGAPTWVEGPGLTRAMTIANGGKGGQGGQRLVVDTGVSYARGGQSTTAPGGSSRSGQNGEDGGTTDPNVLSNVGKGCPLQGTESYVAPGSGGGASAFRTKFRFNGTWYPGPSSNDYYESKGGQGGGFESNGDVRQCTEGVYGGGGGSKPTHTSGGIIGVIERDNGCRGGNGIAIILAFRGRA